MKQLSQPRSKGIPVLDGWRGISILCVLATHMLPLGPGGWGNAFMGPVGMSLFFTLSGFLITTTLLERQDVRRFFIRRACRIVPLAVLYSLVALVLLRKGGGFYLSHVLFLINYDHAHITELTSHFWSLCVEVHFYLLIGLLIGIGGRRGFIVLPLLCLLVTALRVAEGSSANIKTHLRVDEILAGACLALAYRGYFRIQLAPLLRHIPQSLVIVALLLASHPAMGPMNYARPYLAATLVATTLYRLPNALHRVLVSRFLWYIATVSYALYVIHKLTMFGWLGTGGGLERYLLKRPISFALTFAAAHLSTFYYEKWWIDLGKRLTASGKLQERPASAAPSGASPDTVREGQLAATGPSPEIGVQR